jgi:hypothetical protein
VECPHWDGVLRIDSACYYCLKVSSGLIRSDFQHPNGSALTDEQRRFIGWVDPYETGQTVFVDTWQMSPLEAWEKMVGTAARDDRRKSALSP